jgi:hypothetical protein
LQFGTSQKGKLPALPVTHSKGRRMPGKFFNVVVVRSIEATVEIVVEANSADDAGGRPKLNAT